MTITVSVAPGTLYSIDATFPEMFPATLDTDGAWTWFTGPEAVCYAGTRRAMYCGFVRKNGDVAVAAVNLDTGVLDTPFTLHAALEVDDHDNAAVHVRPDGRLLALYTKHNDATLRARISTNPEDISAWGAEFNPVSGITRNLGAYSNPYALSAEGDRIIDFFRGTSFNPTMTYSDDDGVTWTGSGVDTFFAHAGETRLFAPSSAAGAGNIRPYAQYACNGVDRFDVLVTYGHPREEAGHNHVYHFYYKNNGTTPGGGSFYKTDGTLIRTWAQLETGLPILASEATKIHDYSEGGDGWVWSIEYDGSGNPVVTYVVFDDLRTQHNAKYAYWNGSAWVKNAITDLGGTIYGNPEKEYSPGVVVDPTNTNRVYLCRKVGSAFELEQWTTANGGTSWSSAAITASGGSVKNFRPVCPRNWLPGAPHVVWAQGTYTSYTNWDTAVKLA